MLAQSTYKHTNEQCSVKLTGIKKVLNLIESTEDNFERRMLVEQANIMCDELLRELQI